MGLGIWKSVIKHLNLFFSVPHRLSQQGTKDGPRSDFIINIKVISVQFWGN